MFPDYRYDAKGIYIPRLYGQDWRYWYREHGLRNVAEIKAFVIKHHIKLHPSGALEFRDIPKEMR
jgi:hypothetical protein